MEEQMRPPLSQNELMSKLVKARKVMTLVDGGNYEKGNIDESKFIPSDDDIKIPTQFNKTQHLPSEIQVNKVVNEEKIRNSKLPEAVKLAMINNPIEKPSIMAADSLDMKIFEGAKRLMKEDSGSNMKHNLQKPQSKSAHQTNISTKEIAEALTPIIENTIRKILDEKLTQILAAHDTGTINENLVLKVGDSIFSGKITKVKNSK